MEVSPGNTMAKITLLLLLLITSAAACRSAKSPPAPAAPAPSRLTPDAARLAASPELAASLAATPFALFRFVNEQWTRATCDALADEIRSAPIVRLHGDAHIEQYALTLNERGLDDFDDSARGPAAVDLVRFAGSIELAASARDWHAALPTAIDSLFEGYRRGLEEPEYLPPDPAVVLRLRAEMTRGPKTFVAWADSLMQPLTDGEAAKLEWPRLETGAAKVDPAFTPAFLQLKKVGWLRMGIGSALDRKLLARIEGPSPALEDDVVVEAKQVRAHATEVCGDGSRTVEPFRVVEGLEQLGRLRHGLLVAIPTRPGESDGAGWWVREWDPSYREVDIASLTSPAELSEVAFDAGVQLGSSNLGDLDPVEARQARLREHEALTRLEARIRVVAHDLTIELVDAWNRMISGASISQN
jgi:hypothetical protein